MSSQERRETLRERKRGAQPWHSVPFIDSGPASYLVTAACFEHRSHLGRSVRRMTAFTEELLGTLEQMDGVEELIAWAVLPNHYHVLCNASDIASCKRGLGRLHGRTSRLWNLEEDRPGRAVWFRAAETVMKSEKHYWATVNYIHHNPVKHGCAPTQDAWQWSSFGQWKEGVGREDLVELWRQFPIDGYGKDWDDQDLSGEVPLE